MFPSISAGRGETDHLPEREVPRHHCENGSERPVDRAAVGRRGRDDSSASIDSACSANQRSPLAHLATSPLAEAKVLPISVVRIRGDVGELGLEKICGTDHQPGPLLEGRASRNPRMPRRSLERLVDAGVIVRLEDLLGLAGRRVHGCDGHVPILRAEAQPCSQSSVQSSTGVLGEPDIEREGEAPAASAGLQELVHRGHDDLEPEPLEDAPEAGGARRHDHHLVDHDRVGGESGGLVVFQPDGLGYELLDDLDPEAVEPLGGDEGMTGVDRAEDEVHVVVAIVDQLDRADRDPGRLAQGGWVTTEDRVRYPGDEDRVGRPVLGDIREPEWQGVSGTLERLVTGELDDLESRGREPRVVDRSLALALRVAEPARSRTARRRRSRRSR